MTDRTAILARVGIPWRVALAAGLLSLLLGVALADGLAGEHSSSTLPGARSLAAPRERLLSSLPLSAQGPVSGALGAADPAYRISAYDGGFQALSPGQRLRVDFERSRVQIDSGAARVDLSLRGIGYGTSMRSLGGVRPRLEAGSVVYRHAGLSEWYANGPLGLEQGFTIARAPAGSANGPLTLSVGLSGDVHAALARGGRSVVLGAAGGSSLRYGELAASDARGHTLRTSLALQGSQVLLRIDTRGARYPLRVDPLVQQGSKLTAAGEDGKRLFGYSVAMSEDGDTVLIGAPKDDEGIGAAWVLTRSGESWQQTELTGGEVAGPETTEKCGQEVQEEIEGCGFGRSVALSADGDTALIGSPRAGGASGVARVFSRADGGTSWTETETLTPPGGAPGGRFGKSVALSADGKTALVGAPAERDAAGAAWVFTRPSAEGSAWSAGERLTGGEESSEAHFGVSVALSGDGTTALVGAPTERGPTGSTGTATENAGAAWAFTRTGAAVPWTQPGQMLTGGAEELGEGHFGYSVALSAEGTTALVGARGDHEGAGAAWAYTRSSTEPWAQGPKLTTGGENGKSAFGYSLALSADGNTALIGSPKLGQGAGRALLFAHSASGWSEREELAPEEEDGEGWFGTSVALSANAEKAIVGGPTDDGGVGAAWSFLPGPGVESISPKEGPSSGGTTVTIAGSGFEEASAVDFGSVPAASFTVSSSGTEITAVSPEAKAGAVYVTVTTPAGTTVKSEAARFTYVAPHKGDVIAPTVRNVSPNEGETGGGTPVTISGSGFDEATAVDFGSVPAASFTVSSAGTSITAVSPKETAGTVDVRVSAPAGTSPTNANDRFTFTTLAGSAASGATNGLSAATGTGAENVVLGFGPFASPSCGVALLSRSIAVKSHNRATLRLSWRGTPGIGTCAGKLTIKVKVKVKGRRGKPRTETKTIGVGSFSIAPAASKLIMVKLNAAGRALLHAGHGRLSAKLVILEVAPPPQKAQSAIVHLALQRTRPKRKTPGR